MTTLDIRADFSRFRAANPKRINLARLKLGNDTNAAGDFVQRMSLDVARRNPRPPAVAAAFDLPRRH
jgi:hypothetical protein